MPAYTCARWRPTARASRWTRPSRAPSAAASWPSGPPASGRGFHLFRSSAVIANPRLWSPADPNLYTVKLAVRHEGGVVQRYTQRTGIRTLAVDDGGRMLNGRRLDLRGASMHEEDPNPAASVRPRSGPTSSCCASWARR